MRAGCPCESCDPEWSSDLKAIICAAGGEFVSARVRPKILLEFGGRTLLEWYVMRLHELGVEDVVLVTGHLREQIATVLPDMAAGLTD